ncbi:MAG: ATP-dependent zinc metalloprotease FtsH [Mogibacterium sp.]|nr:ATP-dependent zinc metalloprotease FtsH [Mogibacterium sp.]MBQ6501684.1 ATP-dependent zinc metalloprotease FtsH [Mogibacterium sp.]
MNEVKNPRKPLIVFYIIMLLVMFAFNSLIAPMLAEEQKIKEVDYGTFMTMTEEGNIGSVQIEENQILFTSKDGKEVYRTGVMNDPGLVDRLHASGAEFTSKIIRQMSPLASFFLSWILPIFIFIVLGQFLSRRMMDKAGGPGSMIFNMGKSNARVYVKSSDGIKFDDVEGVDEAEENLQEIVDYLHDPSKYRDIGASMPKGVLLVGPPGTGKTMLAKAVAGEAEVPFFSMSGSEFVEMFVGMGASKVRDLFRQAKEKAPCIVFIDEIDAIGQKRNSGNLGGNDEREQTLNQLLTEMDGFEGNSGVIILAATNRPESLDPALTRPGRFDRRVPVELPDLKGREAILKVHAAKVKTEDDIDYLAIARMASGASGAELANIVNEAALRAVRDGRSAASQSDFEESIEVVIAGYEKKNSILTDHEKKVVAYHEIGHALVAAMQLHSAPVQKITIVPRTSGALGYTLQVDEGDHYLMTKEELENKIATLTGGRAAEEVAFGSVTTGASNDIEQATKIARAMITRFGMSDDFDMVAMEAVQNQYLGGDTTLSCSAETQAKIDEKVVELVKKQHEKARKILLDNRSKLDELAEHLYEKETITGEEFMSILEA